MTRRGNAWACKGSAEVAVQTSALRPPLDPIKAAADLDLEAKYRACTSTGYCHALLVACSAPKSRA